MIQINAIINIFLNSHGGPRECCQDYNMTTTVRLPSQHDDYCRADSITVQHDDYCRADSVTAQHDDYCRAASITT